MFNNNTKCIKSTIKGLSKSLQLIYTFPFVEIMKTTPCILVHLVDVVNPISRFRISHLPIAMLD